jgi:hypothetical protein
MALRQRLDLAAHKTIEIAVVLNLAAAIIAGIR